MQNHRSLRAWQEARAVSLLVLQASEKHWRPWAQAVFSQLQRSSLSVQVNISEGYTFNMTPTYVRHLSIAYGSAVESGDLIELAIDAKVLPRDLGDELLARSCSSQRLLLGLLKRHRPM